ncbi:MAG TPA: damage-inducible protein CinA, partial [Flavobacterium sp.]|nr:damage-inducible protein CinA [Flavobacterium sp.]
EGIYKRPITQVNKDQALVPSKARVLFNKMGTAPGMWVEHENTIFISLPGVPYEMKYLVDFEVVPQLIQQFKRPYIIHQTLMTYGRGESLIAEQIEEWENKLPSFIKLAYLPSPGRVRLRLTARGEDENVLKLAIKEQITKLTPLIEDIIVGFEEEDSIEVVIGNLLKEKKVTIATAESLTGGKIGQLLSAKAGASAYFKGSIVTYATQSKIDVLKVSKETIDAHSVVSEQVALEMVKSVKKIMKVDYAIATTGNAGPAKGDSDADLGFVFIAIATPNGAFAEQFDFGQPREKVIDRATNKALEMVYKEISKK